VLLFALQGLTYPSFDGAGGPSWGYYAALVIALGAGAQSYLGFTHAGGSLAHVSAAFKAQAQAVKQQQSNQQGAPYGGQAPYPGQAPYGQEAAPQQPPYQQPYQQPQQPTQAPAPQPQDPQQPPTPPYSGS